MELKELPYLCDILLASKDTLEEIRISMDPGYFADHPLWGGQFPRLRELVLEYFELDMGTQEIATAIGNFLALHPTLESLEINTYTDYPPKSGVGSPPGPLLLDDLPNLQVFKGNPYIFAQFARRQPACLRKSLRRVELFGDGTREWAGTIVNSLDVLLQEGMPKPLLPALEEFHLYAEHCEWDGSEYHEIIRRFVELFGNSLRSFRVKEPGIFFPANVMAPIYAKMANLEEIRILSDSMDERYANSDGSGDGEDNTNEDVEENLAQANRESYVRMLAASCLKLKAVLGEYAVLGGYKATVFEIERIDGVVHVHSRGLVSVELLATPRALMTKNRILRKQHYFLGFLAGPKT